MHKNLQFAKPVEGQAINREVKGLVIALAIAQKLIHNLLLSLTPVVDAVASKFSIYNSSIC